MTIPRERSRAVVATREFLIELAKNDALPDQVRQDAKFLLRHFPTADDIDRAGRIEASAEGLEVDFIGPVFSPVFKEFQ
ncbi:BPSL0761 family protein [Pseudomonas putida]|uniref:BPSL0761 family protein n=2 Tax=Pseudomonas TaxID=286 RepID=UPI002632AEC7|nr:BPSL0761 family protein [uncultured Pseudomonas sp.]